MVAVFKKHSGGDAHMDARELMHALNELYKDGRLLARRVFQFLGGKNDEITLAARLIKVLKLSHFLVYIHSI